jgi:hypothetical protein
MHVGKALFAQVMEFVPYLVGLGLGLRASGELSAANPLQHFDF